MAVANFEQIVLGLCEVLKLTPPALVPAQDLVS